MAIRAQANPDNLGNILNVNKRLADFDEMGIDVQAVSINPFWYWADADLARKIIQVQTRKLPRFARPTRTVSWAWAAWPCSILHLP